MNLQGIKWTGEHIASMEALKRVDPRTASLLVDYYTKETHVKLTCKSTLELNEYGSKIIFIEPNVYLHPSGKEVKIVDDNLRGVQTQIQIQEPTGWTDKRSSMTYLQDIMAREYCKTPVVIGETREFVLPFKFDHNYSNDLMKQALVDEDFTAIYIFQRRCMIEESFAQGWSSKYARIKNSCIREATRVTGYSIPISASAIEQCERFGVLLFNDHRYSNEKIDGIRESSIVERLTLNALDMLANL